MITDKTLVHGMDADLILIARVGVALTQATKDNVDMLMKDLEQSRNNAAQFKETLKKDRDEGHKLKRKYEDMITQKKDTNNLILIPRILLHLLAVHRGKLHFLE